MEEFLLQASPKDSLNFPFVLIGNKIDTDPLKRNVISLLLFKVSKEKVESWLENKSNVIYFESSAKECINVEEAFEAIARNALKQESEAEM